MKIVVVGGSGLIGADVVRRLTQRGHEVLAASLATGVNAVTGEGLREALAGARVVVDVLNSPSFVDAAVLDFFRTTGRNIQDAEAAAGVGHHVALTIVGADRLPDSGYLRAKVAQEHIVTEGSVPYTIVRSTQFFEFLKAIAEAADDGNTVRLTPAFMQPIAAADVAAAVADVALGQPINGVIEIAGPQALPLDELGRRILIADGDHRRVTTDGAAPYFGAVLEDHSLTPGEDARLGSIRFDEWLAARAPRALPSKTTTGIDHNGH